MEGDEQLGALVLDILSVFTRRSVVTADLAAAEARLVQLAEQHDALGHVLVRLAGGTQPRPLRQLCLVVLHRNVVEGRWHEKEANEGGPGLSSQEKSLIRESLPPLLADRDGRIRKYVAMSLGVIGKEDWPEHWPGFLDGILSFLTAPVTGAHAGQSADEAIESWVRADGALRCMETFTDNVSNHHAAHVAGLLFPALIALVQPSTTEASAALANTAFGINLRTLALKVLRDVLSAVECACSSTDEEGAAAAAVMDRDFTSLIATAAATMQAPGWGARLCALKFASLKVITFLVQSFVPRVKPVFSHIVAGVGAFLAEALLAFRELELDAEDSDAAAHSEDGVSAGILDEYVDEPEESTPGTVLLQGLMFLQTCLMGNKSFFKKALAPLLPDLGYFLVCISQLSESQLGEWGNDSSSFLRDELEEDGERGMSVRQEVKETISDIVDLYGMSGLASVLTACVGSLSGEAATAPPSPFCVLSRQRWKNVEAAIYTIGSCKKYVVKPECIPRKKKGKAGSDFTFDLPTFMTQLIDLIGSQGEGAFSASEPIEIRLVCSPYVVGRCLWCAARLAAATAISEEQCEALLAAAVEGLQPDYTTPVRVMACKALNSLLPRVARPLLESAAPLILERLTSLIMNAIKVTSSGGGGEAGGHSVLDIDESAVQLLELLVRTCAFAKAAAAASEPTLTSLLLHMWCRKGTHPILAPAIAIGLEAMIALDEPEAAMSAMRAQLPVITSLIAAAVVAVNNDEETDGARKLSLPPLTLPDGSDFTLESAGVSGAAEMGVMIEAAFTLLSAVLRRTRELSMAVTASNTSCSSDAEDLYMLLPDSFSHLLGMCVHIIQTTQDHKLMAAGASLLAAIVRLVGPKLPPAASQAAGMLSIDTLVAATARLIVKSESVSEEVAAAGAPVITALLSHSHTTAMLPLVMPALLERLCQARMPSLVARLAHSISHCIITDMDESLALLHATKLVLPDSGFLSAKASAASISEAATIAAMASQETVIQDGLTVFLRVCAHFIPLISSALSKQVVFSAVMRLLAQPAVVEATGGVLVSTQKEALSAYGISGPKTRSRGPITYEHVSLPVRLLTLVIQEWAGAVTEEEEAEEGETEEEEGTDEDTDEEGAATGGGGGQVATSGKYRKSPFVSADLVEGLMEEAVAAGGGRNSGNKHKKGSTQDDYADMVYLSDLISGGDAMGSGNGIAGLLASGNGFGDDDDDDDGGLEGGDFTATADQEARDEIAIWDEMPEPSEEGIKYRQLPHDKVISAFVVTDAEGFIDVRPSVGELTDFLIVLAKTSASAPDTPLAALVTAAAPHLDSDELQLLTERILPLAHA